MIVEVGEFLFIYFYSIFLGGGGSVHNILTNIYLIVINSACYCMLTQFLWNLKRNQWEVRLECSD